MSPLLAVSLAVGIIGTTAVAGHTVGSGLVSMFGGYSKTLGDAEINLIASTLKTKATDMDGDGVLELADTAIPGRDPWGNAWVLCKWDRGTGDSTEVLAAVISAGKDKALQTDCALAATGKQGDDLVRRIMLADAIDPLHASDYRKSGMYRKPVAYASQLSSMDPAALRPGELILALDNHQNYAWTGSAWALVTKTDVPIPWLPTDVAIPAYTPPVITPLQCGGGSCLAALDPSGPTTFFAGPTSYAAGLNSGDFGAGYINGSSYTTFQVIDMGSPTVAVGSMAGAAGFITSGGLLFTAGNNSGGRLGNGNAASTTAFSQVAAGVSAVAIGTLHTIRVDQDGSVWATGTQLYFKKASVTVNLGWEQIYNPAGVSAAVAVAAGDNHTAVLLADGTLMTSGFAGTCGVLGNGQVYSSGDVVAMAYNLAPQLAGVTAIAASGTATFAVRAGELLAAGCNSSYELGTAVASGGRVSAFRSTGVTGVRNVAAANGAVAVIKTNNELWAAGYNAYCQFKSPANASTNWLKVADNAVAIWTVSHALMWQDTSGAVWGMGRDSSGRYGLGTTGNRCTPVRVR